VLHHLLKFILKDFDLSDDVDKMLNDFQFDLSDDVDKMLADI